MQMETLMGSRVCFRGFTDGEQGCRGGMKGRVVGSVDGGFCIPELDVGVCCFEGTPGFVEQGLLPGCHSSMPSA